MKLSLVLPILTALAGFGLGWLVKPAPDSASPTLPPVAASSPKPAGNPVPAVVPPNGTPAPARTISARPVREIGGRGVDVGAGAGKTAAKSAAKLQRLTEALGLSDEQQAALTKLIEENQKAFLAGYPEPSAGPGKIIEHIAATGVALEKSLVSMLSPDQLSALEELRKRERENRIEATAQRELANLTEVTDLDPGQRDKILAQLRKAGTNELGSIPASLALVLDSSVLPLGSSAPSAQTVQTLRQLASSQAPEDPEALHARLIENQQRQLEQRLNLVRDILTPAQLAQYQAAIAEQQAIYERMVPPQKAEDGR